MTVQRGLEVSSRWSDPVSFFLEAESSGSVDVHLDAVRLGSSSWGGGSDTRWRPAQIPAVIKHTHTYTLIYMWLVGRVTQTSWLLNLRTQNDSFIKWKAMFASDTLWYAWRIICYCETAMWVNDRRFYRVAMVNEQILYQVLPSQVSNLLVWKTKYGASL